MIPAVKLLGNKAGVKPFQGGAFSIFRIHFDKDMATLVKTRQQSCQKNIVDPKLQRRIRSMKKVLILVCAFMFIATMALAAGPKTYQVTGPVLEIKGDVIVVEKGKEKWEVAKSAATKVGGDLKVGSKVTIEYTMTAVKIDVKEEKKADAKKK